MAVPLNRNTSGVDAPPPMPPPPGGYAPWPPPPRPPAQQRRRRWPALAIAGSLGAITAGLIAVLAVAQIQGSGAPADHAKPTVTVTVDAPAPAAPNPLPTAQADRRTCERGWIPAGSLIDAAQAELAKTPPGITVGDPAVLNNPEWAAAVKRAGELYLQAGDTLAANIAPGATPILTQAANTAVDAVKLLGDAISTRDPVNGNAGEISNAAAAQLGALCQRLAPR